MERVLSPNWMVLPFYIKQKLKKIKWFGIQFQKKMFVHISLFQYIFGYFSFKNIPLYKHLRSLFRKYSIFERPQKLIFQCILTGIPLKILWYYFTSNNGFKLNFSEDRLNRFHICQGKNCIKSRKFNCSFWQHPDPTIR